MSQLNSEYEKTMSRKTADRSLPHTQNDNVENEIDVLERDLLSQLSLNKNQEDEDSCEEEQSDNEFAGGSGEADSTNCRSDSDEANSSGHSSSGQSSGGSSEADSTSCGSDSDEDSDDSLITCLARAAQPYKWRFKYPSKKELEQQLEMDGYRDSQLQWIDPDKPCTYGSNKNRRSKKANNENLVRDMLENDGLVITHMTADFQYGNVANVCKGKQIVLPFGENFHLRLTERTLNIDAIQLKGNCSMDFVSQPDFWARLKFFPGKKRYNWQKLKR